MTAQEAAQAAQERAKESWSVVKHYRLAIGFIGVGVTVAAAGLYYDEIKEVGGLFGGIIMQALGVLSVLMERTAKKAGTEVVKDASGAVSEQVYQKLRTDLDDMRDAHIQAANVMLEFTSAFSRSEAARQRMHDENVGRSDHFEARLDEQGEAINHIGEAVKALKPDWEPKKLRPNRGETE